MPQSMTADVNQRVTELLYVFHRAIAPIARDATTAVYAWRALNALLPLDLRLVEVSESAYQQHRTVVTEYTCWRCGAATKQAPRQRRRSEFAWRHTDAMYNGIDCSGCGRVLDVDDPAVKRNDQVKPLLLDPDSDDDAIKRASFFVPRPRPHSTWDEKMKNEAWLIDVWACQIAGPAMNERLRMWRESMHYAPAPGDVEAMTGGGPRQ